MATRNYATDYVIHAHAPALGTSCGRIRARDFVASSKRSDVTCKRCLASLAKRDREFRRKARAGIKYPPVMYPPGVWPSRNAPTPEQHAKILLSGISAARAIAREEGRAL